jgi:hypothetical protein
VAEYAAGLYRSPPPADGGPRPGLPYLRQLIPKEAAEEELRRLSVVRSSIPFLCTVSAKTLSTASRTASTPGPRAQPYKGELVALWMRVDPRLSDLATLAVAKLLPGAGVDAVRDAVDSVFAETVHKEGMDDLTPDSRLAPLVLRLVLRKTSSVRLPHRLRFVN